VEIPDSNEHSVAEIASEALQAIINRMGLRASVVVTEDTSEQVVLNMTGADLAILIGRQGETLNALQLIVGVIANRAAAGRARIVLDAEGYRERRAEALRQRAHEVARQVKETGREALLESLLAFERRVIHLELAEDPDVYTYSEGEGEDRALVISPRD